MPEKTFIEDLLSLGADVLTQLADARHELKAHAKGRAETLARELDLVTRDEFDAAFAMLSKARSMQEDLSARVEKIESFLNLSSAKKTVNAKRPHLPSVKKAKSRRAKK